MEKLFCEKCGRERPRDLFLRDGEFPYGEERRFCTLPHPGSSQPSKTIKPKKTKKALEPEEKRRRQKYKGAITTEMYQASSKRRRQMTRKTVFHPTMSKKGYRAYLQSPHWIEFVDQYRLNPDVSHECFVCGSDQYDLHHRTYNRLGHERLEDVLPLCRKHHDDVHRIVKAGKRLQDAHLYIRQRYVEGTLGVKTSSLHLNE